eukprot:6992366-Pyramimonas_sp.AAC.1
MPLLVLRDVRALVMFAVCADGDGAQEASGVGHPSALRNRKGRESGEPSDRPCVANSLLPKRI